MIDFYVSFWLHSFELVQRPCAFLLSFRVTTAPRSENADQRDRQSPLAHSLASFLPPSAPLFRIAPTRTSSVCSPRKKRGSSSLVAGWLSIRLILCKFTMQFNCKIQHGPNPLFLFHCCRHHLLPSATFPMSEFRKRLIYCSTHN